MTTTTSFHHLPGELRHQVCGELLDQHQNHRDNLDRRTVADLKNLQLCTKELYLTATPILYRRLTVSATSAETFFVVSLPSRDTACLPQDFCDDAVDHKVLGPLNLNTSLRRRLWSFAHVVHLTLQVPQSEPSLPSPFPVSSNRTHPSPLLFPNLQSLSLVEMFDRPNYTLSFLRFFAEHSRLRHLCINGFGPKVPFDVIEFGDQLQSCTIHDIARFDSLPTSIRSSSSSSLTTTTRLSFYIGECRYGPIQCSFMYFTGHMPLCITELAKARADALINSLERSRDSNVSWGIVAKRWRRGNSCTEYVEDRMEDVVVEALRDAAKKKIEGNEELANLLHSKVTFITGKAADSETSCQACNSQ
ncbi:hypothetical protein IAR55_002029 [Kwoniella newhampshirensis]|uniref:F-box domain-containing protein n=1 Tax=Kwoniella newhampshirensis TaxID=1651941 RepID=A0AAW0Z0I8_9TREE